MVRAVMVRAIVMEWCCGCHGLQVDCPLYPSPPHSLSHAITDQPRLPRRVDSASTQPYLVTMLPEVRLLALRFLPDSFFCRYRFGE